MRWNGLLHSLFSSFLDKRSLARPAWSDARDHPLRAATTTRLLPLSGTSRLLVPKTCACREGVETLSRPRFGRNGDRSL